MFQRTQRVSFVLRHSGHVATTLLAIIVWIFSQSSQYRKVCFLLYWFRLCLGTLQYTVNLDHVELLSVHDCNRHVPIDSAWNLVYNGRFFAPFDPFRSVVIEQCHMIIHHTWHLHFVLTDIHISRCGQGEREMWPTSRKASEEFIARSAPSVRACLKSIAFVVCCLCVRRRWTR